MAKKRAASSKAEAMAKYVVLPARGLKAEAESAQQKFFFSMESHRTTAATMFGTARMPRPKMRILDSIHEDKAKLVEMTEADVLSLRRQEPGVRIVPLVYYQPAVAPRPKVVKSATSAAATPALAATVWEPQFVSAADGKPIAKVQVVAFTDFANRLGASGTTKSNGKVSLKLGSAAKIERLYVYPEVGFWGHFRKSLVPKANAVFSLEPLVFPVQDALAHFYGTSALTDGKGVTVAVVDTGVGPHPDLVVDPSGSENTVTGETPSDYADNGHNHGTHVAGIIASRGSSPGGRPGIAPGVRLLSYRVFGKNSGNASNFSIAKAIDRAVENGADLINLSLGGGPVDPAIVSAIADARDAGVAVIAAAGNDDRSPVSFPASDNRALAVSAMGRKGTFPQNSVETADIAAPYGTQKDNFVAAFSNIGQEIAVTSTGVGIVSTVSGGYVAMNGTSMACPAVTGFAAKLLSQNTAVLQLPRNQGRSDAIVQLILAAAKPLGFGLKYEGAGLPR